MSPIIVMFFLAMNMWLIAGVIIESLDGNSGCSLLCFGFGAFCGGVVGVAQYGPVVAQLFQGAS